MLGIGTMLAGMGVSFIKDLIMDNGEDLVLAGINKVTGIDLTKKAPTAEDIVKIKEAQTQLMMLDFEKLKLEYDQRNIEEQEKTKRWESDNKSEGKFNKNVRPGLVVYLVMVISVLALFDGNVGEFEIESEWVNLFTTLSITAVGGYFTLRTYEKGKGVNR